MLLFLGVPAALESEGFDRDDIELPAAQLALPTRCIAANPRTVVVLSNGGVVRLSGLADRVPAIVEGWLLGQAGGGAVADVLYGVVNPSGRLAETIPLRLADSPAYLDFPGEHSHVRYGEGLFVGYRWYDARELEVAYPFGHGLSYTTFEYSDASVSADDDGPHGARHRDEHGRARRRRGRAGLHVAARLGRGPRARASSRASRRSRSPPASPARSRCTCAASDLAYWDTRVDRWVVEGGAYAVEVGASSRDIRATVSVDVEGDAVRVPLTMDSSIGELMAHPVASQYHHAGDVGERRQRHRRPHGRPRHVQDDGVVPDRPARLVPRHAGRAASRWSSCSPRRTPRGSRRQVTRRAGSVRSRPFVLWCAVQDRALALLREAEQFAVCAVPSSSVRVNVPHLPAHVFTVFQT